MRALGSLLGGLGAVTFSFGLFSLLMALVQPLMPMTWVWGNLGVGVLLLVAAGSWSFDELRERMRSGGGRRSGVYGTSALVSAGLGLAILAMLAFLSTRYTHRFDWTEQHVNTLSEQTRDLLAGLERDVELTAFFREQDSPVVRDLLDRYAHASERVTVRFVDPNQRPDLVEAHALDLEDLARGLLLVTSGDASVTVGQFSEPEVTNALLKLTRRSERKVYFLTGHAERRIPGAAAEEGGEHDEAESADGPAGYGRVVGALRNETHEVEPLFLATGSGVPDDADVVVIAGPTRPLFDAEREALEAYLVRGGALFVLIDPRAQTNLYDDLHRWGAEIGDDVIVDPVQSLNRQATAPVVTRYAEAHPIGESLGRTVYTMVRSVSPAADSLEAIAYTSETSWAERDLDGWVETGRAVLDDTDLAGPVPFAVAGTPVVAREADSDEPRLVVVGDSNFATNELLDVFSNRDFFLNAVAWLIGDVEQIGVRANVARSSSVQLTAGQFQAIQYLSLFVLPEGIALIGVLSWWSRRRS